MEKELVAPMMVTLTSMGAKLQSQNRVDINYEKLLVWELGLQRHFEKTIFHCV